MADQAADGLQATSHNQVRPKMDSASELKSLVDEAAKLFAVFATPPVGASLGVILESGDSDVGRTGEWALVKCGLSHSEAMAELAKGADRVLLQFHQQIMLIRSGIEEGWLVDDGSYQYATAQVVMRGDDDAIIPVGGFSIACNPEDLGSISEETAVHESDRRDVFTEEDEV